MNRFFSTFAGVAIVMALAPALCLADEVAPEMALTTVEPAASDVAAVEFTSTDTGEIPSSEQPPYSDGIDDSPVGNEDADSLPADTTAGDTLADGQDTQPSEGLAEREKEPEAQAFDNSASSSETTALSEDAQGAIEQDGMANTVVPDAEAVEPAASKATEANLVAPSNVDTAIKGVISSAAAAKAVSRTDAASTSVSANATGKPVSAREAPAKKATALDKSAFLIHNAVYYLSSALAKKGAYVVGAKEISGKAKVNVVLAKSAKGLAQYWRAVYRSKGVYRFVNYAGGYYLAVQGAVKKKANVRVAKSGVIDWKLVKNADGTYSLRPATGAKAFLSVTNSKAVKGANIRLWDAISNAGQKFSFTQNKRLTKAYETGKTAQPGVVKLTVADSSLRVGIANDSQKANAKAKTADDAKSLSQVFQMRYLGNGLYEFQNANSCQSLSVYKSAKKAGTSVVQGNRSLGLNQVWSLEKAENGYRVVSAQSGLVLDVAGGTASKGKRLVISERAETETQLFDFTEAQLVENGTYVLQSAMSMPFVLAVQGDSTKDKANVQINRSLGSAGEKFTFTYLGNGVYRIVNAASKKRLDVESSSKRNGANVQMGKKASADSQKWIIELGSEGLLFKSLASGKYLSVKGSQAKSGANVVQRVSDNTSSQAWKLMPSTWKYYSGVSAAAMKFIRKAESYEGWRYQWGGRSPSTSFDCAGLVMYCSNSVLGTAYNLMYTNAEMLYDKCKHISASKARPGDLVFYRGTYGSNVNYISHVVIYTGQGYMYGAGDPIGYSRVDSIKNIKGKTATALYARIK